MPVANTKQKKRGLLVFRISHEGPRNYLNKG